MVPVIDLSRRGRRTADRFARIASAVAASGTYLLGEQTWAFEREFGEWLEPDDPPLVAAVASGASALQLAMAAIGIVAGDEVIIPAFTAVPTAAAVCALGAVPVPVDVGDDAALDPALIAAATTDRTRAVVVVHLYGRPAPLPATNLPVIEDAAQAHGALTDHGRSAATAYSFYPTKNLGGIGDGGAVVTRDPAVDVAVRRLRVHGMTDQYVHTDIAQNFRMSELEAAWLRSVLPELGHENGRRREIASRYRTAAPSLAWHVDHERHVHHLCVLRRTDRDAFRQRLTDAGVASAIHYPLAITEQPAYRHFTRDACPSAEAWARECVTVPCFPDLDEHEIDQVTAALAHIAGTDIAASDAGAPVSPVSVVHE